MREQPNPNPLFYAFGTTNSSWEQLVSWLHLILLYIYNSQLSLIFSSLISWFLLVFSFLNYLLHCNTGCTNITIDGLGGSLYILLDCWEYLNADQKNDIKRSIDFILTQQLPNSGNFPMRVDIPSDELIHWYVQYLFDYTRVWEFISFVASIYLYIYFSISPICMDNIIHII